jgi:hypothetical protein
LAVALPEAKPLRAVAPAPVAPPAAVAAPARIPAPVAAPIVKPRPAPALIAPTAKVRPGAVRKQPSIIAGPQIPSRYKVVEGGVETQIGVQLYGTRLGAVPLRVLGSGVPSVRLGDLLGLLRNRLDTTRYDRLATSAAADSYVSLGDLRAAGIPVRYDAARDELNLGDE